MGVEMMDYSNLYTAHIKDAKVKDGQITGRCPFHKDVHSSFSANIDSGQWICFAGCGNGNAFTFCKKIGLDPTSYINGHNDDDIGKTVKANRNGRVSTDITPELSAEDKRRALEYYKYLDEHFDELTKNLAWEREIIEKTYTGYDQASRRFTFLELNSEGRAVNLKFHKGKDGTQPFSIPGHGGCRLYPLNLIKGYSRKAPLIFCEGHGDALTLLSQGYQAVTSNNGALSIPPDIAPLRDFQKIMTAYDHDSAGWDGSMKLAKMMKTEFPGMQVSIAHWNKTASQGFDIGDYFSNGGTLEWFDEMLANAEPFELIKEKPEKFYTPQPKVVIPEFKLTDAGNAELLIDLHGDNIRYNHTRGRWYLWGGQYWKPDEKNGVIELAIDAARARQRMAADIVDKEQSKKAFKYGLSSENLMRINACLNLAKGMGSAATLADDWDKNKMFLQFDNGLMKMDTMIFRPGTPEDMISQSTGFDYDLKATCPTWEKAIGEILDGNSGLISFLQRAIGYSLTGDITQQCFFLLYGSGANGKSVILEVLRSLLGDFSADSPFSTFEFNRGAQSNDLARLNAARLVTSAESGTSKRLDEERLKAITGGDAITVRFLYQEYFQFTPQFKLWLAVNSLPSVRDFSHGFWRRIRLIPFNVKFDGKTADPELVDKLKQELPGIMNWALEGYSQWKKDGLNPPEEVTNATKDYKNESDVVAEFLDSFVNIHTQSGIEVRIKASDLYRSFFEWHEKEYTGPPVKQTAFGRRVSMTTGIKSEKVGSYKYYLGLELKNDPK